MSTWPASLEPYAPKIDASCGHRVTLDHAFVMADEQTAWCDSCLLLVACSDSVRHAAVAPRRLPALRPVETTEDDEAERDRTLDHLRHISTHEVPRYGCHWCIESGFFFR